MSFLLGANHLSVTFDDSHVLHPAVSCPKPRRKAQHLPICKTITACALKKLSCFSCTLKPRDNQSLTWLSYKGHFLSDKPRCCSVSLPFHPYLCSWKSLSETVWGFLCSL